MEHVNPLDHMGGKLRRYVTRFDRILFLCVFGMAILVHLYMFTHKFINHDDVGGLYSSCGFGLSSGRWLLHFAATLTGSFSSSWVNGVAGSLYMAAAAVLITRLFRIRRYLPALLMALCLVSFPVLASTYAYMFSSSPYLFALMLAALGALLIRQETIPAMLAGSVAIALSMGCYQAYFALAATLLVVVLGLDLLEDRFGGNWKAFLLTGIKYVLFLGLGMVLYLVILKVRLWMTGVELVSYQGISSMGQITLGQLLQRIVAAYKGFAKFCLDHQGTVNQNGIFLTGFPVLVFLSGCLSLGCAVAAAVTGKLCRRPVMMVFLLLLMAIFPLATCLVYVMTEPLFVHHVMIYPLVIPLILPAIALDRLTLPAGGRMRRQAALLTAAALLAVLIATAYQFVMVTNRAYFYMEITYENVYAFYTKLETKVELHEGFTPDAPVAFIGTASMDSYVPNANMTGIMTGNQALNIYSLGHYLMYFHGTRYNFVSPEKEAEIMATGEFQQMPVYPAAGSIQTINGVITVRLS